jgi:serine/threonine-protein kinase
MTQTQAVIGTAQYLSPEQAQGHAVDARSDLYSAGCLLFELLTGRTPFTGDSPVAIAYQHVGQPPPRPSSLNPEVSEDLDAVVLHALAKDRESRYQTASAFRSDLQAARTGRPVSAAAHGTAAGAAGVVAGAAATQAIPRRSDAAATTVLGTGGYTDQDEPALQPLAAHGNTATLPAIGRDPDEEEPRRRRGWAYALLIIAVIGSLVLLAFAASQYLNRQDAAPQQVSVPNVVGKPQAVAEAEVRQAGLVPKSAPVQSEKEEGTVVDQNPQPGGEVSEGTQVSLNISAGPGEVVVPDLEGFGESDAETALENLGLVVAGTKSVHDTDVEQGKVVNTRPAAGETVEEGTGITLNLSSGKVEVPDVVGKDRSEAVQILGDKGLKVDTKFEESDEPENSVIEQTKSGDLVDYGSTIRITVAQPKPPTPTTTTTTTTTTTPPPTTTTTTAPPTTTAGGDD